MTKLTLKHATLCHCVLYLPAAVLVVLGIVAAVVGECVDAVMLGILLFIVLLVLALVYLLVLLPFLIASELLFSTICHWKKDRLWYDAACNGTEPKQIEQVILRRIEGYGKTVEDYAVTGLEPIRVQYKSTYSPNALWSMYERVVIVYRVDHLDESTYRNTQNSTNQILAQLKSINKWALLQTKEERKAPVCRAAAVIVIADSIDHRIPELVRKLPEFHETAVVPCVVDLYTARCYFDGMKEPRISGAIAKNMAIELVKKMVFDGRLPLRGNEQMVYTAALCENLDTPLSEYVKQFFAQEKESKASAKRLMSAMGDGDLQQQDDLLYIKREERVASFLVAETQEDHVVIFEDDCWSYPKHHKIAAAVLNDIKTQVIEYYAAQDLMVKFSDDIE